MFEWWKTNTNPFVLVRGGDDALSKEHAVVFVELVVFGSIFLSSLIEELEQAVGQNPAQLPKTSTK